MIGKIAQLLGFIEYHRNRILGRTSRLIEHKPPAGTQGNSDKTTL
jgi:hypothetical protein